MDGLRGRDLLPPGRLEHGPEDRAGEVRGEELRGALSLRPDARARLRSSLDRIGLDRSRAHATSARPLGKPLRPKH